MYIIFFQSFIESIRDLLQVSSHAQALCSETKKLDSTLQGAASCKYYIFFRSEYKNCLIFHPAF